MKENKTFFLFRSFRFKIMCFFILAMIFLAALSGFLIYDYALKSQFEQLREKLITISKIAAINVDTHGLLAIPLNKEGLKTIEYKLISENLTKIKDSIPVIKYIYILAKTDNAGILKFIVDVGSGNEGPESYPGLEYNASRFPEMLEGFISPTADKKLAADEWGVFLSGYAPIYDTEGKVIALLGVDMKAQDVYEVQKEVKRRAIFVLLLGIVLSVMLGFIISGGVSKQIRELAKGAQRISKGELTYRMAIKGSDEIARLSVIFNKMSQDLKLYIEELKRTTAEKERMLKELEIARRIQRSFLPEEYPKIPGLDIAAINIPARMVSGDFYDFIPIEPGKWGLVIADVSGKGVPAALFMALSRTLLRASASIILSPSDTLSRANELIMRDSKSNLFVTLFYAVVDSHGLVFKYANAGHNPPIFVRQDSSDIIFLKTAGTPLGIYPDIQVVTEEFVLKKNDLLVLYTDGVIDAVNDKNEHFDMDRLSDIIRQVRNLSSEDIMAKIQEEVSLFVGGQPQFDDITLMIIKAV